jgi:redox-sensitive bicupin YhaK (pirin superfamily)
MIAVRRSGDRGFADHGWLKSRHSFSFADYHDPAFMGHGPLRVINEDRVAARAGFGEHSHRDMEILSWVLSGALRHKDSIGTGAVIVPGEMQRMTAGSGITHSEFNDSATEPVHFLQIWIVPATRGLRPGYQQRRFTDAELTDRLCLVASGDARESSVLVNQDTDLFVGRLTPGAEVTYDFEPGRLGWLQISRGRVEVGGESLEAGDGAALDGEARIRIVARDDAEVLLFDMAAA